MHILAKQPQRKSSANEVPPAEIVSALQDSLSALRLLEKALFESEQPASGLLVGQVKVILLRLQHGLPAGRAGCS